MWLLKGRAWSARSMLVVMIAVMILDQQQSADAFTRTELSLRGKRQNTFVFALSGFISPFGYTSNYHITCLHQDIPRPSAPSQVQACAGRVVPPVWIATKHVIFARKLASFLGVFNPKRG